MLASRTGTTKGRASKQLSPHDRLRNGLRPGLRTRSLIQHGLLEQFEGERAMFEKPRVELLGDEVG